MKRLCVYYGWPSCINGARNPEQAAAELDRYRLVVIGDGLEDRAHPDHEATRLIVAKTRAKVFGYIDVGVTTRNLPVEAISQRAAAWRRLGVRGVLLDDFGKDFGVWPLRAAAAVRAVHDEGLRAVANAWDPRDCLATGLGRRDFLLAESWPVKQGLLDPEAPRRAARFAEVAQTIRTRVLSVSTAGPRFDPELFVMARRQAERWGHYAWGWGEPCYSADSRAPWRGRSS